MSQRHTENDVTLAHAGLLAYFHGSITSPHTSPSCDRSNASSITLLSDVDKDQDADEESTCGFWGEQDSFEQGRDIAYFSKTRRGHRGFYAFCCFWCAGSVCVLGAFGAFFVVDLVWTQFGMGPSMVKWIVHGNSRQSASSYEMHFCLATPNPQAPGPQRWRYIRPDGIASCSTEVVTLSATANEHWKLRLDDENAFGDDIPRKTGYERSEKNMSVDEQVRLEEFGDDLAEEGDIRQ